MRQLFPVLIIVGIVGLTILFSSQLNALKQQMVLIDQQTRDYVTLEMLEAHVANLDRKHNLLANAGLAPQGQGRPLQQQGPSGYSPYPTAQNDQPNPFQARSNVGVVAGVSTSSVANPFAYRPPVATGESKFTADEQQDTSHPQQSDEEEEPPRSRFQHPQQTNITTRQTVAHPQQAYSAQLQGQSQGHYSQHHMPQTHSLQQASFQPRPDELELQPFQQSQRLQQPQRQTQQFPQTQQAQQSQQALMKQMFLQQQQQLSAEANEQRQQFENKLQAMSAQHQQPNQQPHVQKSSNLDASAHPNPFYAHPKNEFRE